MRDRGGEHVLARPSGIEQYLARERVRVDAALAAAIPRHTPAIDASLREAVEYALRTEGKRIRPILCVAAYRAASGAHPLPDAVYTLACAVEIVHTYSLVHDDLPCMDDDDLRRGRPTTHRVYGSARATVAGAALLPLAVQVLDEGCAALDLPDDRRARLVIELMSAAGAEGMVGGQLLDLQSEQRPVDGDMLEGIHRRKTGALLVASVRLGALAAAASETLLAALTTYAEALGLAFQIADDLLDVEGSSADLGKTAGRDAVLAKASYPALFGVDGARRLARARVEEAQTALDAFDLPELHALADYVIDRRS